MIKESIPVAFIDDRTGEKMFKVEGADGKMQILDAVGKKVKKRDFNEFKNIFE